MRWDPNSDCFSYEVSVPPTGFTKRTILSTIARLFDPLGFLSPAIFYAKCTLQGTWQLQVGWDEKVPPDICSLWTQFTEALPHLSSILIPRALPKTDTDYQLLCFSDASESGFCAVIYLRSMQGTEVSLTLLKAKTRLAPLKTITIPRLELCEAVLLAQLLQSLDHLRRDLNIERIFCFTDPTIVLSWLTTLPHLIQTFVSNRVQQVHAVTQPEWWHHIGGSENPADVGSRGILPSALGHHPLWWSGRGVSYPSVTGPFPLMYLDWRFLSLGGQHSHLCR
uniref:Pol polyprotein n=1 Tax=Lygus hesperus TaxID=30085 RepID=A0A0A9YT02_LYGHE